MDTPSGIDKPSPKRPAVKPDQAELGQAKLDQARLNQIKLLLLDVDGVLTDGQIIYTDSGEQIKSFSSKDGLGLRLLMDNNIRVGIITGRKSAALGHRLQNLGIDLVFDGIQDKAAAFDEIMAVTGISQEHIAFVGDDLIDLPAMIRAGISFTVPDAPQEVKHRADRVTSAKGGHGAVREICESILKAQGVWENIINQYLS